MFRYILLCALFFSTCDMYAVDLASEKYTTIKKQLMDKCVERAYEKEKDVYHGISHQGSAESFILYANMIRMCVPDRSEVHFFKESRPWLLASEEDCLRHWPIKYQMALQVYRKKVISALMPTIVFKDAVSVMKHIKESDLRNAPHSSPQTEEELEVLYSMFLNFEISLGRYLTAESNKNVLEASELATSVQQIVETVASDSQKMLDISNETQQKVTIFYKEWVKTPRVITQGDLCALAEDILVQYDEESEVRSYLAAQIYSILSDVYLRKELDSDVRDWKMAVEYLRLSIYHHKGKVSDENITNRASLVNFSHGEIIEAEEYYKWLIDVRDRFTYQDVFRFRGLYAVSKGDLRLLSDAEVDVRLVNLRLNSLGRFISMGEDHILKSHRDNKDILLHFRKTFKKEMMAKKADAHLTILKEKLKK